MPRVVVTIPAYNEENTIGRVVREIINVTGYEVVVVSDGSTDRTDGVAMAAGATVFLKPHTGLADTFRREMWVMVGIMKPDIIVHTDADGQYLATDIPKLVDKLKEGFDLVLGDRLGGCIERMPTTKRLMNKLGTLVISILAGMPVKDATTGFRAFRPQVAMLPIKSDFTYTVEQILRASKAGMRIGTVPVTFRAREGSSKLMKHSGHYIWQTLKNYRRMTT